MGHRESIQQIITELLSHMNVTVESIEVLGTESEPEFLLSIKDAGLIIGKDGENFSALTHLVRKMVEKKLGEGGKVAFSIDVNGYQAQKVKETYAKIQMQVESARELRGEVELTPMSAYERMMVHEALAELADIKTESRGEGKERRVVIRYVKDEEITK